MLKKLVFIFTCSMSALGFAQMPSSLISYWNFDEISGFIADKKGGNHGTFIGFGVNRSAGAIGSGAFAFNNAGDAILEVGAGVANNFSCTSGITIEALIKPNWTGNFMDYDEIFRKEDGDNRILFSFQNDNGSGQVLSLGLNTNGVYAESDMPLDGASGRPTLAQLKNGNWHHVVVTYEQASGNAKFYIDGALVYTHARGIGLISSGGSATACIGNYQFVAEGFNGNIDEVAIYNAALDNATQLSHYNKMLKGQDYFGLNKLRIFADSFAINAGNGRVHGANLSGKPVEIASGAAQNWISNSLINSGTSTFVSDGTGMYIQANGGGGSRQTISALPVSLNTSSIYRVSGDVYCPGGVGDLGWLSVGFFRSTSGWLWHSGMTALQLSLDTGGRAQCAASPSGGDAQQVFAEDLGIVGWGPAATKHIELIWDAVTNQTVSLIDGQIIGTAYQSLAGYPVNAPSVTHVGFSRDLSLATPGGRFDNFEYSKVSLARLQIELQNFDLDRAGVGVNVQFGAGGGLADEQNVKLNSDSKIAVVAKSNGTYSIGVKASHWLRKRIDGIVFDDDGVSPPMFSLINGDVEEDNEINIVDFGNLAAAFGSVEGDSNWNPNADLDGDGEVNLFDLGIVATNFGATGDEVP